MATLPLRGGAYVQQKKENIRKKRLLHSDYVSSPYSLRNICNSMGRRRKCRCQQYSGPDPCADEEDNWWEDDEDDEEYTDDDNADNTENTDENRQQNKLGDIDKSQLPYYMVLEENGLISVYYYDKNGNISKYKDTEITYSLLNEADQMSFSEGIMVKTKDALMELLQDFES